MLAAARRRARSPIRAAGPERVLLIGDDAAIDLIARKMRAHPEYGLRAGRRARRRSPRTAAHGSRCSGRSCRRLRGRSLATTDRPHGRLPRRLDEAALLELVRRCRELSASRSSVLPQLFDAMGPSVEVDDVEGVTVLGINPPVLSRSSRALKRAMDIVGAGVAAAALRAGPAR